MIWWELRSWGHWWLMSTGEYVHAIINESGKVTWLDPRGAS